MIRVDLQAQFYFTRSFYGNVGASFHSLLVQGYRREKGSSRLNTGFKQGFDSLDHQKLLVKLQNLNVSKLPLPWSQGYLTDKNNASESTAYSSLDQAWRSTWLYPSDPSVQPLQVFYIKDLLSVCNTFTVLDDSMHLTWDQAVFSFRFENYIPAGKTKRKESLIQTFNEMSAAHFFDWLTFAESANQNYFRCLFF